MKQNLKNALLAFIASGSMVSCMDNSFDLKNVDMTIGTTNDISLPYCSTDTIHLISFIGLKDNGVVAIDKEGNYIIQTAGEANIDPITVSKIQLTPTVTERHATLNISEPTASTSARRKTSMPETLSDALYPIGNNGTMTINGTSNAITTKITDIQNVGIDEISITVTLSSRAMKGLTFLNKYHIDDLKFSLPKGLTVTDCRFCSSGETGSNLIGKNGNTTDGIRDNGIITICSGKDTEGFDSNKDLVLKFNLKRVYVNGEYDAKFINHVVKLENKEIGATGNFRVTKSDINESALTAAQLKAIQSGKLSSILPASIDFNMVSGFPTINVQTFTGSATGSTEKSKSINIGNLPDFLADEDVCMDLTNPAIFIDFQNPVKGSASTNISLTSVTKDGTELAQKNAEITLPGGTNSVVILANNMDEDIQKTIDTLYSNRKQVFVKVENLKDLLTTIPAQIKVNIADIKQNCQDANVNTTYFFTCKYNLETPIKFGKNFKLVYSGVEGGINKDTKDYDDIDSKGVRVTAEAYSELPLDVTVTLDALDTDSCSLTQDKTVDGKLIRKALVNVENFSTINAKAEGQLIEFNIYKANGATIGDFLKALDKLQYKAVAKSQSDGNKLNAKSRLFLKNIKVTLLGGITYDAN